MLRSLVIFGLVASASSLAVQSRAAPRVKKAAAIYALYGLQFFFTPTMVIEQHFDYKPDPNHIFLARGSGIPMLALAYSIYKGGLDLQAIVLTVAATALVYPLNGAYISKLAVKYPMHYVPEVLMSGLTIAGLLAMQ